MSTRKSDYGTLWELIKGIRFGMLTHRHTNGMLHAHPLTTQNQSLDEGAQLYFFISRKSELSQRLLQDGNVNVSYADPGKDSYVSLSGEAVIAEDQEKKEQLWSPIARSWFPAGVNDPDLALLEVRIHHAEYWDVKESKMVQLFKLAKAAITGEPPRKLGEHKELRIS
jgi:general stress protein 26